MLRSQSETLHEFGESQAPPPACAAAPAVTTTTTPTCTRAVQCPSPRARLAGESLAIEFGCATKVQPFAELDDMLLTVTCGGMCAFVVIRPTAPSALDQGRS